MLFPPLQTNVCIYNIYVEQTDEYAITTYSYMLFLPLQAYIYRCVELRTRKRHNNTNSRISISRTPIFRILRNSKRSVYLNQKYILIAFSNHNLAVGTYLLVKLLPEVQINL